MKVYLGIDVGSVTTKLAVLGSNSKLLIHNYLPTQGDPIGSVQQGLVQIKEQLPELNSRGPFTKGEGDIRGWG